MVMGFSIVSYGLHTLIIWISYTGHMNFIYPAYGFHILFIGFSYCWHTSGIPEPCLRYSGGITQAYGLHTLLIRFSYENHMGTIHESYGKHTWGRFGSVQMFEKRELFKEFRWHRMLFQKLHSLLVFLAEVGRFCVVRNLFIFRFFKSFSRFYFFLIGWHRLLRI